MAYFSFKFSLTFGLWLFFRSKITLCSLLKSSVDAELASGDKCKGNASRCWKSLVNTVSNFQSDSENLENNRSHLLLTLDSLHLYPVHSIQGVRRYLGAIFLLHSHGDFVGAVDLCAKVSVQLENINRRLKRVETKLIKHCSRRQRTTPGSSESASNIDLSSPISRAKRDAGWIHFWYYVLVRIRSVVHWHEFQFRMVSDPPLFFKVRCLSCPMFILFLRVALNIESEALNNAILNLN